VTLVREPPQPEEPFPKRFGAPALAPLLDGSTAGELIPELVCHGLQQLIELEVAAVLGAERYERSEERPGHLNGYRPRQLTTQVGDIFPETGGCRRHMSAVSQIPGQQDLRRHRLAVASIPEPAAAGPVLHLLVPPCHVPLRPARQSDAGLLQCRCCLHGRQCRWAQAAARPQVPRHRVRGLL
jgi:hypothetical protein